MEKTKNHDLGELIHRREAREEPNLKHTLIPSLAVLVVVENVVQDLCNTYNINEMVGQGTCWYDLECKSKTQERKKDRGKRLEMMKKG